MNVHQDLDKIHEVLQSRFKLETFRPLQLEIIQDILNSRDLLVLMRTGGGKSLCYHLPALLSKGVTVIISPLISYQPLLT